jgi:uncharacterized protein (DUF934 family)
MPTFIKNRQIVEQPSPPDLVVLEPTDDPREAVAKLGLALPGLKLIAINFQKYGDGRGYSIARLLRDRYGYKGELRAVGVVARDHLQLMAQCGFDSFQLREGEDAEEALKGLDDFSEAYQANAAQPVPLFRRRVGR